MRVLQLIDSLEAGGAERMAVSIANELAHQHIDSFLCTTRVEGSLRTTIRDAVCYKFIKKKATFDIFSLVRLNSWIKKNKIDVIHAHSSSFLFGYLIKIFQPGIILIWHDHYGDSEHLKNRNYKILRFCSKQFNCIISVNEHLRTWALKHLRCDQVYFLNNFVSLLQVGSASVSIEGDKKVNIVCLANLRPQKDHLNLLKAFKKVSENNTSCALHLLGKIDKGNYYNDLLSFIREYKVQNVYFYGTQTGVIELLKSCDIAVLSSKSEGLPVSLLEYGMACLPVVCTNVGECEKVLGANGKIVEKENASALSQAILYYVRNENKRVQDGTKFHDHVLLHYSEHAAISKLIKIYQKIL